MPVTGYATAVLSVHEDSGFMDSGELDVEQMYARSTMLVQPWDTSWCEATYTIRYVQGLPLGQIPHDIVAAVKRIASHWFQNRVPVQQAANAVPLDLDSILAARRTFRA